MMWGRSWCLIGTAALCAGCSGPGDRVPAEEPVPEGVYGQAPPAVAGTPSVISLLAPFVEVEPVGTPVLDQFGLAFSPTGMVVRVGQLVEFRNSESLPHNIHLRSVDSDSTVLNVDTDPGGSHLFTFDEPGGYDVFCDLHPGMRAFIYASLASYSVLAEPDGSFVFPEVPPGSYSVTVWSVDPALRSESSVEVGAGSTRIELPPTG